MAQELVSRLRVRLDGFAVYWGGGRIMTRMTLKSGVIAALLLTVGGAAQAVLVGAAGTNPYSFSWSRTVTGLDGLQHTLTGNGSFTVSGFNSTTLTIVATLNNTSAIGGPDGERLISFSFGIDPNATNVDFVDDADGGIPSSTPSALTLTAFSLGDRLLLLL